MNSVMLHTFGNPSSIHIYGKVAHSIIEEAREQWLL